MYSDAAVRKRYTLWSFITLATLFMVYFTVYFCRTNITVSSTLLVDPDKDTPLADNTAYGAITTTGTFVYCAGKLSAGFFVALLSIKVYYMLEIGGTIVACVLFGLGTTFWWLLVAWSINRWFQAAIWACTMQIMSEWFPKNQHGFIVGVLSISFLAGDAAARGVLGGMIEWFGFDWRGIFFTSAGLMTFVGIFAIFLVHESPTKIGLPALDAAKELHDPTDIEDSPTKPTVEQSTVNCIDNNQQKKSRFSAIRQCFQVPAFYCVCLNQITLTFIRETFRDWLPILFRDVTGVSDAEASIWSFVYPAAGCISAILIGWVSDRLPGRRRGPICFVCFIFAAIALWGLWGLVKDFDHTAEQPEYVDFNICVTLAAVLGVGLYGVYGHLATFAIDICVDLPNKDKDVVSAMSGLTDGIGYFAGAISGILVGNMVDTIGWGSALLLLAGVSLAGIVSLAWYTYLENKRIKALLRDIAKCEDTTVTGDEDKSLIHKNV